ncbi:hypothetical protein AB9P05_08755 [Roseivirga sp. BDSF3-8]|uniref:hypothetical protein n=1 Tax=Roseivirga sp. BDSF3-8 TaxID=3241598 RepID=UPI0035321F3C
MNFNSTTRSRQQGQSRALAHSHHAPSRALANQDQRSPLQLQENESVPSTDREISVADVQYELLAHGLGYMDEFTDQQKVLLANWGFKTNTATGWSMVVKDEESGFFAGLLLPNQYSNSPAPSPVLVFRGTQEMADWTKSNTDPYAVGYTSLICQYGAIQSMIDLAGGHVVMTGHSLGGSLAKQAALAFPGSASSVYTYQAPGVSSEQNGMNAGAPVVNHIAEGDIVHRAGGGRLQGQTHLHHPSEYRWVGGGNFTPPTRINADRGVMSHSDYLLSGEAFAEQQQTITPEGWDWTQVLRTAADNEEKSPVMTNQDMESFDQSPIATSWHETGRRGLGNFFRFHASIINDASDSNLRSIPFSHRLTLMRGVTSSSGAIQNAPTAMAVYKLISTATSTEVKSLVNSVGFDRLLQISLVNPRLRTPMRSFLQNSYYPSLSVEEAVMLMSSRMSHQVLNSEFRQEMIRDILFTHSNPGAIISRLGSGNYNSGLNRILRSVDFTEDREIRRRFGNE